MPRVSLPGDAPRSHTKCPNLPVLLPRGLMIVPSTLASRPLALPPGQARTPPGQAWTGTINSPLTSLNLWVQHQNIGGPTLTCCSCFLCSVDDLASQAHMMLCQHDMASKYANEAESLMSASGQTKGSQWAKVNGRDWVTDMDRVLVIVLRSERTRIPPIYGFVLSRPNLFTFRSKHLWSI